MPDDSSQPFRVLNRASQVEIFLHGEIVPGMAEPYACTLTAAGSKPVLVRLHSPGGDWLEASAMYSATERHPGRTVGLVEGLAASSASFLLQAFNERRINANGIMMVHPPYMAVSGRAEDHASAVEALTAVRTRLAAAYRRSGQPAAVIEEWVTRESWFTAGEALGAGLVDAIDAPARVAVSLDVTRFTNAPPAIRAALGRGRSAQLSNEEDSMDAVTERPDDTAPATDTDTTPRRPGRNTALAIIRAGHSGWGFPKWRLSSPRAGPATPMPRSS